MPGNLVDPGVNALKLINLKQPKISIRTRLIAAMSESVQAKDPAAQIGFALAAADSAARNFSLGDARLTYNAACVELAARVGTSAGGHRRNQTDFAPAPGLYRKRSLTPSLLRGKTE